MGFSDVCHGCGILLYQERDLIHLYRLRRRTDGKCPGCKRKLAMRAQIKKQGFSFLITRDKNKLMS